MKKPELSLENRVALITGAAGGIGEAIARSFGVAGAKVFLHGRDIVKLKVLSNSLSAEKIENSYHTADITASGAAEKLMAVVMDEMGAIDILVNSAGINRPQPSTEVSEKNWDDVMNINLKAMFFACQAAGKIINISSQAGIIALPLRVAYCSSKGGVNQLTRTLAVEWARHKINVNAVAPTFVETPFTRKMFEDASFKQYVLDSIPLGRMVTPEEVAYATLFLASGLSDMVTGHIFTIDGGWTVQ